MCSKKKYTYERTIRHGLISVDNTYERMKYKSCGRHYKIRPKSESILKRLGKSKDRKKSTIERKPEKEL